MEESLGLNQNANNYRPHNVSRVFETFGSTMEIRDLWDAYKGTVNNQIRSIALQFGNSESGLGTPYSFQYILWYLAKVDGRHLSDHALNMVFRMLPLFRIDVFEKTKSRVLGGVSHGRGTPMSPVKFLQLFNQHHH